MYNFVRVKVCESLWYQKSESFSQLSPGYLPSQLSAHPALCYASVICVLNVKVLKYPPSWSSPLAPAYHISVICFCDIRKVKVEVSFPLLGHIPSLLAAHPVCMYDFKKVKVLWYIRKSESFQISPFSHCWQLTPPLIRYISVKCFWKVKVPNLPLLEISSHCWQLTPAPLCLSIQALPGRCSLKSKFDKNQDWTIVVPKILATKVDANTIYTICMWNHKKE